MAAWNGVVPSFPALFSILALCGALHGEEVPLIDLQATKEFTVSGLNHPNERKRHGVMALHGRFKNEVAEICHLMPLVLETDSGLMPVKWMKIVMDWYMLEPGSKEDRFSVLAMVRGHVRVSLVFLFG
jgi:hypothetical protein